MNKALLDFGLSFLFEEKSFIEYEKRIESQRGGKKGRQYGDNFLWLMEILESIVKTYGAEYCIII